MCWRASQVRRRVGLIAPHTRWLRSFACTEGHELIPTVAREHGLKTMVGAWISHDRERNEREIHGLVTLAKAGLVDIAVVGNEVLLREELPEQDLLGYLARVKAAVPDDVRVGCVDAYYLFLERPALAAACDVLLPNCYPFWEGADIGWAAHYLRRMHALVQAAGGEKPVIVAETGWPGQGQPVGQAVPSDENAMRYFVDVQQWARREGVKLFYFASFDEPWKLAAGRRSGHAVGPVGQGRASQVRPLADGIRTLSLHSDTGSQAAAPAERDISSG